jgi:hypothetical protein
MTPLLLLHSAFVSAFASLVRICQVARPAYHPPCRASGARSARPAAGAHAPLPFAVLMRAEVSFPACMYASRVLSIRMPVCAPFYLTSACLLSHLSLPQCFRACPFLCSASICAFPPYYLLADDLPPVATHVWGSLLGGLVARRPDFFLCDDMSRPTKTARSVHTTHTARRCGQRKHLHAHAARGSCSSKTFLEGACCACCVVPAAHRP